ncbi:MAG: glycogen debranching N-terminal domain-containing protein, partial [Bradymonadaceae bacterium]
MPEGQKDYHIYATSTLTDDRMRVLKHRDLFAVFDRFGEIQPQPPHPHGARGVHGLYLSDMRHLSRLQLRLADRRPLLLSSTVKEDNALMTVDLTNPDLEFGDKQVSSDTIHILRSKFLMDDACHEEISLKNYGEEPLRFPLRLSFGADFADIFELRGVPRHTRGTISPPHVGRNRVRFLYFGTDGLVRQTTLSFSPVPATLEADYALFDIQLAPGWEIKLEFNIITSIRKQEDVAPQERIEEVDHAELIIHHDKSVDYSTALHKLTTQSEIARSQICEVHTNNDLFNHWVARSSADLYMLTTQTEYGPYPYAGTPWYSTVFGRDGLITAYQCLWILPEMARGVLAFLAAHQATEVNDEQDAEPGKIVHEMRQSEMALIKTVPFRYYYGSIDSTLLFIMLAGAYYERTGDLEFIEELWPHLEAAVAWIEEYGDRNGDGYVEYDRRTAEGLAQQG